MRAFMHCAIAAMAISNSTTAIAEDVADDGQAIIVTGYNDGYRAVETTSGTKTSVPILDVPQSISVLTSGQINDQAIRSISDLVRYIPGVSAGQGEGHRDQITLRGNNSTADFFVDGLRDDVQYFRSFYNVDRVEVHKGPNAMIFGRGGGGGILNRVTKGALIDQTVGGLTASADSFGSVYVAGDVNLAFGPAALRLNAFSESLANHRDAFGGTRLGINPTVGAQLGEGLKAQIGYEYVRDDRVVDRGIPSAFAGTLAAPAGPARDARDNFFGVRGVNETALEAHVVRLRTEAELTGNLTFSTQAQYGDYDKVYANVFAATPVSTGPTVGIEAYRDLTQRTSFVAQGNLIWRGATGSIDHVVLIGAEYTAQDTGNERINGFFPVVAGKTSTNRRRFSASFPTLADLPPVSFVRGTVPDNSNRAVETDLKQVSAYLQDQISLGDAIDLIVGLRYDRFDLGFTNSFTGQTFARVDDLWSPRAGLVFKPVPQASIYVSYAKSFLPQSGDQFLSLDLTTAELEPEAFDNYEIGAKWDIMPDLSLTAAVYRLDRINTRAAGPVAGTTVQTGEQRSKGFELGLSGRITPRWQTSLGYAYTDAEITQTTSAAPAGRKVAQVPRHQLSLWNRYDVSDQFGFGLGIYHQARQFATISNLTELPAFTRVDAALFVKLSDRIEAQVNVENLTDVTYFPVAHNDNNISTGAPINTRFTLGFKF